MVSSHSSPEGLYVAFSTFKSGGNSISIFAEITEPLFEGFLEENYQDPTKEFFIPLAINPVIVQNIATMEVLKSNARWFGVTYKQDKEYVTSEIKKLKVASIYPDKLW